MDNWNDPRISRVIELETKITRAIIQGHKATDSDEFKEDRKELKSLREDLGFVIKKVGDSKDQL